MATMRGPQKQASGPQKQFVLVSFFFSFCTANYQVRNSGEFQPIFLRGGPNWCFYLINLSRIYSNFKCQMYYLIHYRCPCRAT